MTGGSGVPKTGAGGKEGRRYNIGPQVKNFKKTC
jgi:hypothetical protein